MEVKISAIIIAKDEEAMLPDCLKSLDWVDEILVVDTGSFDKTVEIAKRHKARVVEYRNGKNYSDWRNKGLEEAKGEWIFYVDADERIPINLEKEISTILKNKNSLNAYAVARRNFVLGKELKHGSLYPDYQKRLFKKSALKNWKGEVHEEPEFIGELGHLENPMIHYKHETFSEMVKKTNKWSEIEAKLMFDANHPPMNIARFLSAMGREFWQRMVVHKAFLDGKIGLIYGLYQVFSRFVSYAKLWEMQLTKK
ncbi:hypothetical protein A2803_02605 [Candidatus Woesebacteria bacterium RIFCSPHIGHO2_01_FULL_44_21]|uniref:Glycosyltransferase 2-like domain-containing protein n=1 Tax=Candidatus Woesebacteria bacterium RIFCSPHIGHO2_01_FULL_44_21 TaxID=1802503 RepID=A0A1F7YZQ2_9BACT|nr:MAG: hypothetical protein A2803_02605 [Candidatus Woesebacteria bacterium RIFCSPHIGHO2_01_FULL_44_21]OGM69837.1 MAG: hypothetical protein A2897_00640 [Candidatus Woesebacteria bacterium RIFCSPLOWO2_01_FULL_44_24b]